MIDLNKVSVQLAQTEVLREISLEVQKEEIVGLIGPAASGKSVLIKTIAGLLSVSSGELLIHDERVEHLPLDAR